MKFMIRYIFSIYFIVLFMNKSYAQKEYKTAQGFYNLSGFELASGIYLLENKIFFYYASFGNVDLKLFGNYKIQNDSLLTFQTDKELIQEFHVYGVKSKIQNDSITLTYQRPFEKEREKLIINKIEFPEFNPEKNTVSISLKRPSSDFLKIEYSSPSKKEKDISIQLTDNVDEVLIFHNYYAHMVRGFSKRSIKIKKGVLIDNNQEAKKKDISEEVINEVVAFIEKERNANTLNREGKTFRKLTIE